MGHIVLTGHYRLLGRGWIRSYGTWMCQFTKMKHGGKIIWDKKWENMETVQTKVLIQLINEALIDSAGLITRISDPVTCPAKSCVLSTAARCVPDNILTGSLSSRTMCLAQHPFPNWLKKSKLRLFHNPEYLDHKTKHCINLNRS